MKELRQRIEEILEELVKGGWRMVSDDKEVTPEQRGEEFIEAVSKLEALIAGEEKETLRRVIYGLESMLKMDVDIRVAVATTITELKKDLDNQAGEE